jgi:hypothetical protein
VAAYEALSEDLARCAGIVAYWSKTTDERLVPGIVARLANAMERNNGTVPWLDLYLYPALLVLYAGGVAAVIGHREQDLGPMLTTAQLRDRGEWKPAALVLHAMSAIDRPIANDLPGLERRHTPMSDHLVDVLHPWLESLEPDATAFDRAFDRFEYLDGLVMYDLLRQSHNGGWGPVGRFSWRGQYQAGVDREIAAEIATAKSAWPLLRAGLFGGEYARLVDSAKGWDELIATVRGQQH